MGLKARGFHTHWNEVNPLVRECDWTSERERRKQEDASYLKSKARQAALKRKGSRILPSLI
jgi:hypothetical protein